MKGQSSSDKYQSLLTVLLDKRAFLSSHNPQGRTLLHEDHSFAHSSLSRPTDTHRCITRPAYKAIKTFIEWCGAELAAMGNKQRTVRDWG
jgi:hypothetical protein